MRFASLASIRSSSAAALRRFPVPFACAWAACASLDLVILGGDRLRALTPAAVTLPLGIALCFALTLFAERLPRDRMPAVRVLLPLVGLAAVALFALGWRHWSGEVQWRRYLQLALLGHALAAFLPYARVREPNGFWQYNRALLERLVVASVFSAVLLAGLLGALNSLKPLFGIFVSPRADQLLGTWVLLLVHPWIFLAGVPAPLEALEGRRDYPATIRVFAQFILVPLVAIYQALLTAYLFKVVVTGKWPSGLIGWMVSAEAVAGILAILLLHPVRERAENLWTRTFARGFHLALIPSVVMLALAIAKRVGQYGVTEDRYFAIALTAWLGGICVYFIARRDGDIRWIPVTLALLALVTFAGPWSAYGVSLASQRARLVRLLEANGMWRDGRAVPTAREIPFAARLELSGTLSYLLGTHGGAAVRPLLGPILAAADSAVNDPDHDSGMVRAGRVTARLGFEAVHTWDVEPGRSGSFSWQQSYVAEPGATAIDGLDYHVRIENLGGAFQAGARSLSLRGDERRRRVALVASRWQSPHDPAARPVDTLATAPLDPLIAAVRARRSAEAPPPAIPLAGPGARGRLVVRYVQGEEGPPFRLYGLTGDLYFTLLDPGAGDPRRDAARAPAGRSTR